MNMAMVVTRMGSNAHPRLVVTVLDPYGHPGTTTSIENAVVGRLHGHHDAHQSSDQKAEWF